MKQDPWKNIRKLVKIPDIVCKNHCICLFYCLFSKWFATSGLELEEKKIKDLGLQNQRDKYRKRETK